MSKDTFISRFSLIIKRLERGPATFEQIARFLEDESGINGKDFALSIRTLQRDIKHINEQLGFEILNEKKGNRRYFINSRPESQEHSLRLLEAYDMLNIVKASQQYNKYMFFEDRRPKGLEHFSGLLYACSNKKVLSFTHKKFWNEIITNRTVHPLAIKEARGRWYLVAIDTKDNNLKTFGLDRMNDLEISKASFREKYDINLKEIFFHTLGIINESGLKPEKVVLSLSNEQGQYLLNYPLHHSQIPLKQTSDEIVIELHVLITLDLVMELQSFGANLKVLKPKKLVDMLVTNSKRVIGLYKN